MQCMAAGATVMKASKWASYVLPAARALRCARAYVLLKSRAYVMQVVAGKNSSEVLQEAQD